MKRDVILLFWILLAFFTSVGLSDEGKVYPIEQVKQPIATNQPLPPYTEEAKQARIEDPVLLEGIITAEGKVRDIKVIRGLGYGLDESAAKTVTERWIFKPATYEGKPVDTSGLFEIHFRLLDKIAPLKREPKPEPEPVSLSGLRFKCNRAFTSDHIRATIAEKLSRSLVMNKDDVDEAVRELYQAHGYIRMDTRWLPDDTLCIQEGKQFHLGKLDILDATVFPTDYLLSLFELKEGDVLNFTKVRNGVERVRELYSSIGLENFHFEPEQRINEHEATMNITFTFRE